MALLLSRESTIVKLLLSLIRKKLLLNTKWFDVRINLQKILLITIKTLTSDFHAYTIQSVKLLKF